MTNQSGEQYEKRLMDAAFPQEVGGPSVVDVGTAIDIADEAFDAGRQAALSEGRRLGLEEAEIVADTDATKTCNLTGRRIAKAIRALIVGGGEVTNG